VGTLSLARSEIHRILPVMQDSAALGLPLAACLQNARDCCSMTEVGCWFFLFRKMEASLGRGAGGNVFFLFCEGAVFYSHFLPSPCRRSRTYTGDTFSPKQHKLLHGRSSTNASNPSSHLPAYAGGPSEKDSRPDSLSADAALTSTSREKSKKRAIGLVPIRMPSAVHFAPFCTPYRTCCTVPSRFPTKICAQPSDMA